MHTFLIFCIISVVSAGRLDGYAYQHPVSHSSHSGSSGGGHGYHYHQQTSHHQSFPMPSFAHTGSAGYSGSSSFNAGQSFGFGGSSGSSGFNYGSSGGHSSSFGTAHAAPIVSKHFYIHSAPEETEEEVQQQTVSLGPGRKNYRVLFIKAPTQSAQSAAISFAQAQNEEKTVIYVLSKKTDVGDIQAHVQAAPHHETKPEVFFIKYKTPAEAAHAQRQIQAQYASLGGSTQFSDEGYAPVTSVIGALGGGSSHQGSYTSGSSRSYHGSSSGSGSIGSISSPSQTYLPPSVPSQTYIPSIISGPSHALAPAGKHQYLPHN